METLSTYMKAEIAFVAMFNLIMGVVMLYNTLVMLAIMEKLGIEEKDFTFKNILKGGKND